MSDPNTNEVPNFAAFREEVEKRYGGVPRPIGAWVEKLEAWCEAMMDGAVKSDQRIDALEHEISEQADLSARYEELVDMIDDVERGVRDFVELRGSLVA